MKDSPIWWRLDPANINDLQQDSISALVKRCKGAHFTNVKVRINGAWEEYEADWIKHLVPQPRPTLMMWRQFMSALGRPLARFRAMRRSQHNAPDACGADASQSMAADANTSRAPDARSQ